MPAVRFPSSLRVVPLVLAASLAHGQPQVRDARDTVHVFRVPAQRIVSLLPSLTETVCALGACDQLVGIDRYSNWPADLRHLPQLGSTDQPQIEGIVALRPDLVLLHPRSRAIEPLERLGIRVLAFDARTHAQMREVMDAVAVAIGRPGAGRAAWQRIDARLDAARARIPANWRGRRVYFDVHGVSAASEASFIGETLQRLGLANVVPGHLGTFPKLSPEFVLRAAPDVVMAPALGNVSRIGGRPGWSSIEAIRTGRLCLFESGQADVLLRAGPRLDEAADAIVDCLRQVDRLAP